MFWRVPGTSVGPEAEAEGDGVGDFSSEDAAAQEGREAGPQGEAPAERAMSAWGWGGGGTSLGLDTGTRGCVKPSSPTLLEKPLGLAQFSQEVRGACWWPRDSWTVDL